SLWVSNCVLDRLEGHMNRLQCTLIALVGSSVPLLGCSPAPPDAPGTVSESKSALTTPGNKPFRPPGVPNDFHPTPDGWFHPSCVVSIGADEKLHWGRKRIERADGTHRPFNDCQFPIYNRDGSVRHASPNGWIPPAAPNGWQESLYIDDGTAWTGLEESWYVPNYPPAGRVGQTDYMFPAFTPDNGSYILQPVLGYMGGIDGRYHAFPAECCLGGNFATGPTMIFDPGVFTGGAVYTEARVGGDPHTWIVNMWGAGNYSELDILGLNETWQRYYYQAALEVYDDPNCSALPGSGYSEYTMDFYYSSSNCLHPALFVYQGDNCSYGGHYSCDGVDLDWRTFN